ncbi:type IV secretion system DotC family protein [Desulfovibrio sp. OttesenSCG-928-G15]|nr:type IV secretion system DotC family protein [Desulfovibrio sp. OttesenSCG-928-G15]
MAAKKLLLMGLLAVVLVGCAGKKNTGEPVPPVPVPPQTVQVPEKEQAGNQANASNPKEEAGKMAPYDASYEEEETAQYLAVKIPADHAAGPHKGEPDELAELLEMRGSSSKENTAVMLMRPAAIRESAQLVSFQTALAWRYKQLVAATESHGPIMDTAFDFSPLVMTQGEALIMPPLLTRAGASMRIEKPETATAAETTYELLEPARYVTTVPNWREFLMTDGFPEPEKPNPAVLPKNNDERAIWRAAVREAWAQGLAEADQLYADNVARMVRNYRGVMLYHLLTAQHLLSKVKTASADLGMHTSDNKLNIGQKVYRITSPSVFTAKEAQLRYSLPSKASKSKKNRRK